MVLFIYQVKLIVKNKNGVTLIEVLVALAILSVLMVSMVIAMNPILLVNKANDSRRKSDLNKFKIAFEEYFGDNGNYPNYSQIVDWNKAENCNKTVSGMSKYLDKWFCDPHGQPYVVMVGNGWFKVMTNLENKEDKSIPEGWYDDDFRDNYAVDFSRYDVNYGVSSPNILWYETESN